MSDILDSLQIKIEKARAQLPEITRRAIDAVPWKTTILEMRLKNGYTFEQLGDLEIETELLLCGLLNPADYGKEIEKRMGITKAQALDLVNEMNVLIFTKIREAMIKNTEQQKEVGKSPAPSAPTTQTPKIIRPQTEKPKIPTMIIPQKAKEETHPLLSEKFFDSFKAPSVSTEHTLSNLSKTRELPSGIITPEIKGGTKPSIPYPPSKDPYRLNPDE